MTKRMEKSFPRIRRRRYPRSSHEHSAAKTHSRSICFSRRDACGRYCRSGLRRTPEPDSPIWRHLRSRYLRPDPNVGRSGSHIGCRYFSCGHFLIHRSLYFPKQGRDTCIPEFTKRERITRRSSGRRESHPVRCFLPCSCSVAIAAAAHLHVRFATWSPKPSLRGSLPERG